MKTTQIKQNFHVVYSKPWQISKIQCIYTNVAFASESCRVVVLEKSLFPHRYFIHKYIKMIYALLVNSNKYINTQTPTSVHIFDLWGSLLDLNFRLYIVYLGSHAIKNIFT